VTTNNLVVETRVSNTTFHPVKMCFRPIAVARVLRADKNPARSRPGALMPVRHIIQEILVQPIKTSLPRLGALLLVAVLVLQGCKIDFTPDAFSFATQTKVAPDTLIESEPVTISGINVPVPMSIAGGEYSIDGRAYRSVPGPINNNERVRIRVRSSSESSGVASATLTIGEVTSAFTVKTVNFTGRVEAEAASPIGGASIVADAAASKGKAVFLGSAGLGIAIADSLDARTLILAYRSDAAGTLEAKVNGASFGKFTLRPTAGAYATASLVISVYAGDVIAISSPSAAGASETYIDYVQFAASPFRSVSTLAAVTEPWATDGVAVGSNGDIYVSGGQRILRVTPDGDVSVFATGLVSANGSRFDSKGNLFVADYDGSAVRKITPDGVMTTFASGLDGPAGVWLDKDDNLLVSLYGAGYSGTGAAVLKITPDGTVSAYASGGGLQDVVSIVGDEDGNVYAANWSSGTFFNITGGSVSVLAETGGASNHVCYSHGYIYIPSPSSALVRRVSRSGTVETFIGTTTRQVVDGPIASADFERPNSCAISVDGTIMYVMERERGSLRRVDAGKP
jgi:sugar lactone lactonase YvrE